MTTLGINWNGLWNLLTEEIPPTNPSPSVTKTDNEQESDAKPHRLKISIQDLECISDALLHYTKHLASRGEHERMRQTKELDKRIFATLEAMTSFSEAKEKATA